MKRSSELLYQFIAALREEGADLPQSDDDTVSTLTDVFDAWTGDPINQPEMDRTVHTMWRAVNQALDPNFAEQVSNGGESVHPDFARLNTIDELAEAIVKNATSGLARLEHDEGNMALLADVRDCLIRAQQLANPPTPQARPNAVANHKRAELEARGYVVNGVAFMHPGTRKRGLLDDLGAVHWIPEQAGSNPALTQLIRDMDQHVHTQGCACVQMSGFIRRLKEATDE